MNIGIYCSIYEVIAWQMFQTDEAMEYARNLSNPSETHLFIWQMAKPKRKKPYIEFDRATENILCGLQSGKITAYGRKTGSERSEEISVDEWRDLRISTERHLPDSAYLKSNFTRHTELFDLRFLREEVRSYFKLQNKKPKTSTKPQTDITPNLRHREWAKKYYNRLKKENVRSSRDEDEKAFCREFQNSSRQVMRKLRQELVPEWCEPGRQSKKK